MNQQEPTSALPPQIPVRLQRDHDAPPTARRKLWLHPASGLLVLGVDWLFFAPEAATFELAAIITSPLAFIIAAVGVFWIQRNKNGDSVRTAALKALLGGFVAGIPTSIAGTIFATVILTLSGLSNWNQRRDPR